MLKEWLRGSSDKDKEVAEKPKTLSRMVVDAEKPLEPTPEVKAQQRRDEFEKKLALSAKEGPPHPSKMVTYDSIFRKAQDSLLSGNNHEVQEGITLNLGRNVQNTMIATKWALSNPQMSHWELNLQMNGFSDIIAASWNTMNRYQLLYQVMSGTGAMLVTQFMAQKQHGMCQGTMFAMLQYPWLSGGCTQLQYTKGQSFSVSHVQRLVRGMHVGSNLSVDTTTHATSLSHIFSFTTAKKDAGYAAEFNPSKGTWRMAVTAFDWSRNMDGALELEYKQDREGMKSVFSVGCRRNFVGGAQLVAALAGFSTLKVNLDLPFGGEIPGANQFRVLLNAHYDIHSGGVKQGLVFTA